MKLTKYLLIMSTIIVQATFLAGEKALASDNLTVESYYRIRMAIADNHDAGEVANQIHNALMDKGIVITKSKVDPVVEGRVVIKSHDKNKVNPYGIGEYIQHDVVLALKSLKIKDSLGNILASYQSFSGFGGDEIESRAFAYAAEQIVEQLKETDFISQAAKIARRQDIFINTAGKVSKEEIQQEISDVLNGFMDPVVEELQLTRKKLKADIEGLAKKKAEAKITSNTVYINGSELDKIIFDHIGRPVRDGMELHKVKEPDKRNKDYSKGITGIIIDAQKIKGVRELRLQRIYSESGTLVFGGKRNPNFNPLLHFESREDMLLSDFKVEAKNPITVQAIRLTAEGHIVVSNQDADEILLANKWGEGKIFSEGRIFVLTGTY